MASVAGAEAGDGWEEEQDEAREEGYSLKTSVALETSSFSSVTTNLCFSERCLRILVAFVTVS